MKKSHKVVGMIFCAISIVIAVSLFWTIDARAQLTGSDKLVPVVWNNGKVYFFQYSII